jgi:hypothetical protein
MLAAQAIAEKCTLASRHAILAGYGIPVVWD